MHAPPPDGNELLDRLTKRIAKIATFGKWQEHWIAELQNTRADLAAAQDLAASLMRHADSPPNGFGLSDLPPAPLAQAWRDGSPGFRAVDVEIDGADVTIVITGPPRPADPVREFQDWQSLRESHRRVHTDLNGEA